jgi:DeoR/GlpR family transcriptional regulator of sugar metabolism
MNQRRRLLRLREHLQTHAELTVASACRLLHASPATVRRDFNHLVQEGGAEKMWGGISQPASHPSAPLAFRIREMHALEAKRAIARRASALIKEGDAVMLDGGTTTFQLACLLVDRKVRIITNSVVIAMEVSRRQEKKRGAEVLLVGGFLRPETDVAGGWHAEQNIRNYRAKWAFLSSSGFDRDGVTNNLEFVLGSEKAMIQQCEQVVIMADATKLGQRGMFEMCSWKEVDYFVTDLPGKSPILKSLSTQKVKPLLAEKGPRTVPVLPVRREA